MSFICSSRNKNLHDERGDSATPSLRHPRPRVGKLRQARCSLGGNESRSHARETRSRVFRALVAGAIQQPLEPKGALCRGGCNLESLPLHSRPQCVVSQRQHGREVGLVNDKARVCLAEEARQSPDDMAQRRLCHVHVIPLHCASGVHSEARERHREHASRVQQVKQPVDLPWRIQCDLLRVHGDERAHRFEEVRLAQMPESQLELEQDGARMLWAETFGVLGRESVDQLTRGLRILHQHQRAQVQELSVESRLVAPRERLHGVHRVLDDLADRVVAKVFLAHRTPHQGAACLLQLQGADSCLVEARDTAKEAATRASALAQFDALLFG
jgi:hypothetical protein